MGVFAHFKISSSSNSRPPKIYQDFIIPYSHILHCIYSYHLNIPDTNDASATNDEAEDDEKAEGEEDVDVDVLHPAHRLRLPLQFVQTCHHFEREKRCNIIMHVESKSDLNNIETSSLSSPFNVAHAAALKSAASFVACTIASVDPVVERVQDEIGSNCLLGMGMQMRGQHFMNLYCHAEPHHNNNCVYLDILTFTL